MTYVENSCQACNKVYTSAYNLKKHLKRQPLCETWINLNPGIKDYIDDKFRLRMNDEDEATINTKCFVCNTIFSNVGNLNKHLETNINPTSVYCYERMWQYIFGTEEILDLFNLSPQ